MHICSRFVLGEDADSSMVPGAKSTAEEVHDVLWKCDS